MLACSGQLALSISECLTGRLKPALQLGNFLVPDRQVLRCLRELSLQLRLLTLKAGLLACQLISPAVERRDGLLDLRLLLREPFPLRADPRQLGLCGGLCLPDLLQTPLGLGKLVRLGRSLLGCSAQALAGLSFLPAGLFELSANIGQLSCSGEHRLLGSPNLLLEGGEALLRGRQLVLHLGEPLGLGRHAPVQFGCPLLGDLQLLLSGSKLSLGLGSGLGHLCKLLLLAL